MGQDDLLDLPAGAREECKNKARAIIRDMGLNIEVQACEHPSVTETSLWLFSGGKQIGAVTQTGESWRASRIFMGMPSGVLGNADMATAIQYAIKG